MKVEEILNRNVVTVEPDITLEEAARKMVDEGTKFLIVTENEKLVGIVTEWDFVKRLASEERFDEKAKLETIMTKKVIVIPPDTEIGEAAEIMAANNIKKLPVVEGNVLIGVVTAMDIIAAEPKLIEQISELVLTGGKQKPVAG